MACCVLTNATQHKVVSAVHLEGAHLHLWQTTADSFVSQPGTPRHLLSRTRVCPTVCFQRLMLCSLKFLEWTITVAGCSWQLPLLALATALFPPNFSWRYGASRGSLKRRALCCHKQKRQSNVRGRSCVEPSPSH